MARPNKNKIYLFASSVSVALCSVSHIQQNPITLNKGEVPKVEELVVVKDGGFKCKCLDVFKEKRDGTCADINECKSKKTCGPRADCINLPGTFECQCLAGLVMNGKKCSHLWCLSMILLQPLTTVS